LALAHKIGGGALFAHKEQELADEMRKNPFVINLLFLEEAEYEKLSVYRFQTF